MNIPSTSSAGNGLSLRSKLQLKTGNAPPTLLIEPNKRPKCRCIGKLLTDIALLNNKKASYGHELPISYQTTRFGQLFYDFVLNSTNCTDKDCQVNQDDMLWYVPMARQPTNNLVVGQQVLQVFRRSSPNKPQCFDSNINWEETVCLNVILQQFDYYVTVAVCIRSQPNNLQILKKNCQRVYPSPSRRRMDVKGECEEMTYPKIYFAIDNFETVFSDIVITENECVCVELVARDRFRDKEAVVFLGSIRFDVLKKLYDSRGNSTWTWAQKLVSATQRRHEFVKMRGPHGKGFAEMAVARVASLGFETPMSEHCYDMSSSYDSRWNTDNRRMSDTNIFGKLLPKRTALTPGPGQDGSAFSLQPRTKRWQSDADSMNNDSDFDARSVVSETTARPMATSQQADSGSKWSLNSFGNALSWLKEKKESPALNAYLTYVTLPWRCIIDDMLLTSPRKPILTFDLDYLE